MTEKKTNFLGWSRRQARACVEWATWSRQRFVGVLAGVIAIVAVALTIAITSVALSVQNAVGQASSSSFSSSGAPPGSSSTTPWAPNQPAPKVAPTTTLTIPPHTAGPEAATRNFAEHFLRGAHTKDYSDDRRRWIDELAGLSESIVPLELRKLRQADMPVAMITNVKTVELLSGAPSGPRISTFDLSDASILVVEVHRAPGGDAPWKVTNFRHKK